MNENAGAYSVLDRFEARKRMCRSERRLSVKVEEHTHASATASVCTRSSRCFQQWFCKQAGPMIGTIAPCRRATCACAAAR
jgi:valyl-tRNA synthetase